MMIDIPNRVNALPQLLGELREVITDATVSEVWPRDQLDGDTVILSEIVNSNTDNSVVDQLSYQVDVWSEDTDRAWDLVDAADGVLCGIGFKRTMTGGIRRESYGYRITSRYSRRLDKRTMRLIR